MGDLVNLFGQEKPVPVKRKFHQGDRAMLVEVVQIENHTDTLDRYSFARSPLSNKSGPNIAVIAVAVTGTYKLRTPYNVFIEEAI